MWISELRGSGSVKFLSGKFIIRHVIINTEGLFNLQNDIISLKW